MGIRRAVTLSGIASVLILPFIYQAAYACDIPEPVDIPDGKTATEREMVIAGRGMDKYFSQFEKYVSCVESDTRARRWSGADSDISSSKAREDEAARRLNEAAAAIEDLVERFNKATADYESRSK